MQEVINEVFPLSLTRYRSHVILQKTHEIFSSTVYNICYDTNIKSEIQLLYVPEDSNMLFRRLSIYTVAAIISGLLISGCGKEEKNKGSTATGKVTRKPVSSADKQLQVLPKLVAADDKDDLRFALLFPESNKIAGWIKTVPVSGGGAEKLDALLPQLAEILKPYTIENISTTQYERIYKGGIEKVRCWLIRAGSSDDAYGMFSVSCKGPDSSQIGDAMRSSDETAIFSVKGVYFGIFKAEGKEKEHLASGFKRLAAKVMFEIAGQGSLPMTVQLLTTEDMPEATALFMRNLISMNGPAGKDIANAIGLHNLEAMNRLLELGKGVDFALASYKNENWPSQDVLWIAKYPTAKQAMKVYSRYRKILRNASPESKLHENTLLKAPRGRFLLGCWTMEIESLAHLMGKVYEHLP